MRKTIAIWTIAAVAIAGAATPALAKPGDQYTLWAGGCLPGDIVNPVGGSTFHCTEALSTNPGGRPAYDASRFKARKAAPATAAPAIPKPAPVAKPATSAPSGK